MRSAAFVGFMALVGACAIGASACGSTLDVGNGSTADGGGGGTGAGDPAACDEYDAYCKVPADKRDCPRLTADPTCGSKAADLYRCFVANRGECNTGYEPELGDCAEVERVYERCTNPDECTTDAECAGTRTPACLISKTSKPNTCVECVTDAQCTNPSAPRCSDKHGGGELKCVECVTDTDCKDASRSFCRAANSGGGGEGGVCVECTGHNVQGGCPTGKICNNSTTCQDAP